MLVCTQRLRLCSSRLIDQSVLSVLFVVWTQLATNMGTLSPDTRHWWCVLVGVDYIPDFCFYPTCLWCNELATLSEAGRQKVRSLRRKRKLYRLCRGLSILQIAQSYPLEFKNDYVATSIAEFIWES